MRNASQCLSPLPSQAHLWPLESEPAWGSNTGKLRCALAEVCGIIDADCRYLAGGLEFVACPFVEDSSHGKLMEAYWGWSDTGLIGEFVGNVLFKA